MTCYPYTEDDLPAALNMTVLLP